MNVLLYHPVLLPPKNYGGTERVVQWLARGLLSKGHRVWVAACPESQLPQGCELLPAKPGDLLKAPPEVDVVHFHAPPRQEEVESLGRPFVVTCHGNGQPGEEFHPNTIFISQDHARRHGASTFVYNGLDPDEFSLGQGERTWNLFLSRTHWKVKNLRGAIKLCLEAGAPLRIAGGERPYGLRASLWLRSLMTGQFKWEGSVNGLRKAKILAESKALIFPVLWPEPFGLVVVEALLSGVPILANRIGSLPELVSQEVGQLFEGEGDPNWHEVLQRGTHPWKATDCRNWAAEHFHYVRMAEEYVSLYERVLEGEQLQQQAPKVRDWM